MWLRSLIMLVRAFFTSINNAEQAAQVESNCISNLDKCTNSGEQAVNLAQGKAYTQAVPILKDTVQIEFAPGVYGLPNPIPAVVSIGLKAFAFVFDKLGFDKSAQAANVSSPITSPIVAPPAAPEGTTFSTSSAGK